MHVDTTLPHLRLDLILDGWQHCRFTCCSTCDPVTGFGIYQAVDHCYFIVCFHEIPPIDQNPFRSLEYNHT
jgi:hypothetical protein